MVRFRFLFVRFLGGKKKYRGKEWRLGLEILSLFKVTARMVLKGVFESTAGLWRFG